MRSTLHESTEAISFEQNEAAYLGAGIASGDEHAFAQVVHRYSRPVFLFLVRMTGSAEDAEDLVQETFLALYKNHQSFRKEADVHPYLFTIARRKAISHLRWRAVRKMVVPMQSDHENNADITQLSPLESVEQREQERRLQKALMKVAPAKRAVVILRFYEGMTYPEIATVLNKPESTVKSMVFRCEQELRKHLGHLFDRKDDSS